MVGTHNAGYTQCNLPIPSYRMFFFANSFHFHQHHSKNKFHSFFGSENKKDECLKRKLPGITCENVLMKFYGFWNGKYSFCVNFSLRWILFYGIFFSLLSLIIILSILSFVYYLVVTLARASVDKRHDNQL